MGGGGYVVECAIFFFSFFNCSVTPPPRNLNKQEVSDKQRLNLPRNPSWERTLKQLNATKQQFHLKSSCSRFLIVEQFYLDRIGGEKQNFFSLLLVEIKLFIKKIRIFLMKLLFSCFKSVPQIFRFIREAAKKKKFIS